jgi:hypothetical protein
VTVTSTGGSVMASGSGACRYRPGPELGYRPGGFGAGTRMPLEYGAAGRFPLCVSGSISARNASGVAVNAVSWHCSAATTASRSARLHAGGSLGSLMAGTIDLLGQGRKLSR